jgi:hypothetical protein
MLGVIKILTLSKFKVHDAATPLAVFMTRALATSLFSGAII